MKTISRYLCKIPNNKESEAFIYYLRKNINSDKYKLRVKGGVINKNKMKSIKERRYRNNIGAIPLKKALFLRLYIDDKIKSL